MQQQVGKGSEMDLAEVALGVTFSALSQFIAPELMELTGGDSYVAGNAVERLGHILAIQEAERRRIASELHDGLGQMLSLLLIELRNAKQAVAGCGVAAMTASSSLERASAGARNVIDELRRSIMALYPSILEDLGLVAALSWVLRDVCRAKPGLRVESHISVTDADVPRRLHISLFRIVQEAVNNVVKHADAENLTVVLRGGVATVSLMITDDGRGIDDSEYANRGHRGGLSGMMRRAHASGGDLNIITGYGSGTSIVVTWPQGAPP
jgi:two-component system NarL family sensor kinase